MLSYLIAVCFGFLFIFAWKVLDWVWLRPTKLEMILRKQGLNGNSYRVLFGDMNEKKKMIGEAISKPINLSDDIVPRVNPFLVKIVEKYGKNSFTWAGPRPAVLITEPDLIKEVLSNNYKFQKPRSNPLLKLLSEGLVRYEGDKWAKHRNIINPAFQQESLKHMLPDFFTCCCEMLSKWDENVTLKGPCELDIWPYLQKMSSDAISRTAFGSNYEEGRKIFELQREQSKHVVEALRSAYFPGLRFLPTKRNRRMKAIKKETKDLVKDIIDKRVKAMKGGKARREDLLDMLLESNFKEMEELGKKSGGMSIEEVIEECKLFYFAGQETTSVLLLWTMVLLSKHPEWQARAREEVLDKFGYEKPGYNELNQLKIVTMILYEVLRLYPPLTTLHRATTLEDTKVGKILVPRGVQIDIPTIFVHHEPEIWGGDAKEFKPERFSEGVAKATSGKVVYFPFGWGPRICIGQNFALLEAKLTLSMILTHFSFDISPSYSHAPYIMGLLQPQHGAHLILHKLRT